VLLAEVFLALLDQRRRPWLDFSGLQVGGDVEEIGGKHLVP
jgi:hypothetical protein